MCQRTPHTRVHSTSFFSPFSSRTRTTSLSHVSLHLSLVIIITIQQHLLNWNHRQDIITTTSPAYVSASPLNSFQNVRYTQLDLSLHAPHPTTNTFVETQTVHLKTAVYSNSIYHGRVNIQVLEILSVASSTSLSASGNEYNRTPFEKLEYSLITFHGRFNSQNLATAP